MRGSTVILAVRGATAFVAAFVTVSTLACEGEPLGADPPGDALEPAGETVPFESRLDHGSFVVVPFGHPAIPPGTPTEDCPVGEANPALGLPAGFPNGGGIVLAKGTGSATHLGKFSLLQTQCAIQFFPETDPPLASFDIRLTLTAANGDQLFLRDDFETFFEPGIAGDPVMVVGGTGRFEGATGSLVGLESVINCTDDTPFCLSGTAEGGGFVGEISTVGSNRRR